MRTVRISNKVYKYLQSKARKRQKLERGESVNAVLERLFKIKEAAKNGTSKPRRAKRAS